MRELTATSGVAAATSTMTRCKIPRQTDLSSVTRSACAGSRSYGVRTRCPDGVRAGMAPRTVGSLGLNLVVTAAFVVVAELDLIAFFP